MKKFFRCDWPLKILRLRRKKLAVAFIAFTATILACTITLITTEQLGTYGPMIRCQNNQCGLPLQRQGLLINTSTCKIPDAGAFNEEIMPYSDAIDSKIPCSKHTALTYVKRNNGVYTLHLNESLISDYNTLGISCCYSKVYRVKKDIGYSDDRIRFSDCQSFKDGAIVKHDTIKVKCRNIFYYVIYENVHALLTDTENTKAKIQRKDPMKKNIFSVTMIGIDSVSSLNLIRSMPQTYYYLLDKRFINLKGYNKVGDNTYPNLIAILTGSIWQQIYAVYDPKNYPMNNSVLIWNDFRKSGYITAYAEDWPELSTFNYGRKGFSDPPTDFYFRPYFLAADYLERYKINNAYFCTGPESTLERVFALADEFTEKYKTVPTFSLFWMTYFSHDNINGAALMDEYVKEYLEKIVSKGSVDNSFLIFFSDHGFRFGEVRNTYSGWLEERLPFIYILVPEKFKTLYREKYKNLLINVDRLSSPFDLHMTLQEILSIGDDSYEVRPSASCPDCHSLFKEHKEDRTCQNAGILSHWCTCINYKQIDNEDPLVQETGTFVVNTINKLVKHNSNCKKYEYVSSSIASVSDDKENSNLMTFMFKTDPEAKFEATLQINSTSNKTKFTLVGDISRIDHYRETAWCEHDVNLKKYCFCTDWKYNI